MRRNEEEDEDEDDDDKGCGWGGKPIMFSVHNKMMMLV